MSKGVQTGEVLELNKLRSHALSDSELGLRMTHLDMAKYCSACSVLVLPRKLVRRRFVALSQFLFATAGLPDKTGYKVSIRIAGVPCQYGSDVNNPALEMRDKQSFTERERQ